MTQAGTPLRWSQPLRTFPFNPPKETFGLPYRIRARSVYPLLHSGSLLSKWNRSIQHYHGRKGFHHEDHPMPLVGTRSSQFSQQHRWHDWDRFLNPQLIQTHHDLPPSPEYLGTTSGRLIDTVGWVRLSGTWKFCRPLRQRLRGYRCIGGFEATTKAPRWMTVPRIAAVHPDSRYEGKLQYTELPLSKVIWAIDCGELNPNEVITMKILRDAEVVGDLDLLWPGLKLVNDGVGPLKYPLNVELQHATPDAISAIEQAGGTFTATYLSTEGMYQELHPEEYPTFQEQQLPERNSFEQVYSNPRSRGYLSQWHEDEGKFSHPKAGRRQSHYIAPPQDRDFPDSYEEYERVKHHQKWHLNQAGSGTVLPFTTMQAKEWERPQAVELSS